MAPTDVRGDPQDIRFTIPVNPARLRINLQYRNSQSLPKDVRLAREEVVAASREACSRVGWDAGAAYVGVGLDFLVNSRKQDADGPLKRVLDAIADGCLFNDMRVQQIEIRREIVEEGYERIDVRLYRVPQAPGERVPDSWKGHEPIFVWENEGGAD